MANVIVLFEVKPTETGMKKYLDLAAMLKPMLAGFMIQNTIQQP